MVYQSKYMTQQAIVNLAESLMKFNNSGTNLLELGWRFRLNNRKTAIGVCNYREKTIFYSTVFLKQEEKEIKDTLLHEIAHALTKGSGHGREWKRMCILLGCKPKRTKSSNNECKEELLKTAKYIAVCKNGHTHYKNKSSKTQSSCGLCDRKFNPNALLDFIRQY